MSSLAAPRKPLGVRVTPEQHRILTDAAKREHRSVSSFVLTSALNAAQGNARGLRTPESAIAAVRRAQELMSKYKKPGTSLVDELIAERRAEAENE